VHEQRRVRSGGKLLQTAIGRHPFVGVGQLDLVLVAGSGVMKLLPQRGLGLADAQLRHEGFDGGPRVHELLVEHRLEALEPHRTRFGRRIGHLG